MNKETYQKIMENLQAHTTACKEHLCGINTTADLRAMTVDQIIALRTFARAEQAAMDTVAGTELYHIIGMGEMNAVQTNSFIKLIKEYLSYRSLLKTIAMNLVSFDTLPGIPVKSHYDLKVLGQGIRLTAGPEDGFEEEETTSISAAIIVNANDKNIIKMLSEKEFIFNFNNIDRAQEILAGYGFGINKAELDMYLNGVGKTHNIYGLAWRHDYDSPNKTHYYKVKANTEASRYKVKTMYNNLRGE